MNKQELLIEEAKKARQLSYSPYSHFAVGAALLCQDGTIFHGTNIENASYPLSMCAERNALYQGYLHGYHRDDFVGLAIVGDTDRPISPCGACRQVIQELFPAEAPIWMGNLRGEVKEMTIKELLPYAFEQEDLE